MYTFKVIVRETIFVEIPQVEAHNMQEAEAEALRIYDATDFDDKQHEVDVIEIALEDKYYKE